MTSNESNIRLQESEDAKRRGVITLRSKESRNESSSRTGLPFQESKPCRCVLSSRTDVNSLCFSRVLSVKPGPWGATFQIRQQSEGLEKLSPLCYHLPENNARVQSPETLSGHDQAWEKGKRNKNKDLPSPGSEVEPKPTVQRPVTRFTSHLEYLASIPSSCSCLGMQTREATNDPNRWDPGILTGFADQTLSPVGTLPSSSHGRDLESELALPLHLCVCVCVK